MMLVYRLATLLLILPLIGCQANRNARVESSESATGLITRIANRVSEPSDAAVRPASFEEDETPPRPPADAPPETIDIPKGEVIRPVTTLDDLQDLALSTNPAVAEASAKVEAARGLWVQVGLYPNTEIGYSGQQLFSDGLAEQHGLFVGQEFVRGHKLELNRAVAYQRLQIANQHLATQQQRVLTDVKLNYFDVLIAQRRIETAENLVAIANQAVETAEALFTALEVGRVDILRARTELQTTELLWKNARNQHTAAWSRLAAVVGVRNLPIQHLDGDIETAITEINPEEMLASIATSSPEMAAALTEVERARWAVDRAYAEPVPNVDMQAVVQSDNGTGSSNANLQVSVPIPWFDHNQGGIREARANVIAAERAVDRLQLHLQQRFADVYRRYADARNQVEDYSRDEGILANARRTLELVGTGYEAGEMNYLELITAQRTFSQTNLQYIEALGQLWMAVIEIDGLLLKGSLESRPNVRF